MDGELLPSSCQKLPDNSVHAVSILIPNSSTEQMLHRHLAKLHQFNQHCDSPEFHDLPSYRRMADIYETIHVLDGRLVLLVPILRATPQCR